MVLKFGKTGQFLGCSKYPECKATRPIGGQPRAEAVESEHTLPQVRQAALDPREQARREVPVVLGLSRVQGVVQHRRGGQPGALGRRDRAHLREVRQADGAAPGLARRRSWAARAIPSAATRCPSTTRGKPVPPVKVEVTCAKCGGPMAVAQGRRGSFLGCTELSRSAAAPPRSPTTSRTSSPSSRRPPRRRRAADLKSIPIEETCEQCGGPMLVRRSRRGFFLGCAKYPKCKGTRQPGEATLAKINAVVGA